LKLDAQIGTRAEHRARADELLRQLPERQSLKLLREETTLLVLIVRVAQQERREAWLAQQGEDDETAAI